MVYLVMVALILLAFYIGAKNPQLLATIPFIR